MREKLLEKISKYVFELNICNDCNCCCVKSRGYVSGEYNRQIINYFDSKLYELQDKEEIKKYISDWIIRAEPYLIKEVENPSEELKLLALQREGHSIQHIEEPSEELKLEAVKQDGTAIRHLENPSEAIQLAAIDKDIEAIRDIKNPTEKVVLTAVREKAKILKYIDYTKLSDDTLFQITLIT